MDVSTLERHALATLRKPLTLKDALLEVSDFRLERRKKLRKAKTLDKGHGRIETRTCWQTDDIAWFEDRDKWAGLKSVCMVESKVYNTATDKTTVETRFFISSLPVNPKHALEAIRAHWGVEEMHWTLDAETLPTRQNFVLIRVSGEKEILMRRP